MSESIAARWICEGVLPHLAEHYSTWAEDGSPEALKAARDHFALGGEAVGHGEHGLHIRQFEGDYSPIVLHLETLHLALGILPDAEALLEPCTVVVVRWRTPELGSD